MEMFYNYVNLYINSFNNEFLSDSDIYSVSSSSIPTRSIMAFSNSRSLVFYEEVVYINLLYIDNDWFQAYQIIMHLSHVKNDVDMILVPYVEGDKACMQRPRGIKGEYFYFQSRLIVGFIVCILFTIFQANILKVINVSLSQLDLIVGPFTRVSNITYWAIGIMPTVSIFFSFYKSKCVKLGG